MRSIAYAADRKCKKIAKLGQLELTLQASKIKRGADNVDMAIKKLAKSIGKGVELKTGLVQVTRKGFPNEITPLSNLWSRMSFNADTMEIKVKYSAQYGNSDAWIDDQVIAFRGGKRPSLFINQVGGYNNQGDGLIEIINLVEVVGNTVLSLAISRNSFA